MYFDVTEVQQTAQRNFQVFVKNNPQNNINYREKINFGRVFFM